MIPFEASIGVVKRIAGSYTVEEQKVTFVYQRKV